MRRPARPHTPLLLLALLLPTGLLAAPSPSVAPPADQDETEKTPTYLILPFENLGEEPSLDWLSTCLALSLGEYLRGLGAPIIDDEERGILLEGSGIPSGARLTLASALVLGRRMRERHGGARPDRTVLGRFSVVDGDLTLSVRSIHLPREQAGPWISREGRLKDLLGVLNKVADALVREETASLPGGRYGSAGRQQKGLPLLTFEAYCRAMVETDTRKRLRQMRRAVREFPDYHRAAYQAAALLVKAERWNEAAEMLEKAAGDPQPYALEFHLLSARAALQREDPAAAAESARRAIEQAGGARAHLLLGRARLALGDPDTAAAELEKAAALDPSEPEIEGLRRLLESRSRETHEPQ